MTDIDQIIARSRRGGGFAERQTFSMSRRRAIKKMREFALADPHFFVLALCQSAVANGATYINIEAGDDGFCLSYVGGCFTVEELENLFDFLFVSGGDPELAHLRELAIGINALMIFEPKSIVFETGDGTAAGSHRVVMSPGDDEVTVGHPTEPLQGTYLAVHGMDRSLVHGASSLSMHPRGPQELTAAEDRIILAPATIPIALNGSIVYGSNDDRVPRLWGYESYVGFDEGDLYGSVGTGHSTFRLVTHGCWVQSVEAPFSLPGPALGGVINFGRLRKTADHSAIVQDATYDEMWARVLPYAKQVTGDSAEVHVLEVQTLAGTVIPSRDLRGELLDAKRVVVVTDDISTENRARAEWIARELDAFGLVVERGDTSRIRALAGPAVEVTPLSSFDEKSLEFYALSPAAPPPRPWLTGAVEVPPIPLRVASDILSQALSTGPGKWRRAFDEALGIIGEIRATIYSPARPPTHEGTICRVITADREVWQGVIPGGFCNQWIDVRIPGGFEPLAQPLTPRSKACLAEEVARYVFDKARPQRTSANDRALSILENSLEPPAASWMPLAVEGLSRHAMVRLRTTRPEGPGPGPSATSLQRPKLLDAKIFHSLRGATLSLHELLGATQKSRGVIYGRLPEVPADTRGLDETRILLLDEASEEGLAALVGETDYVRVDARDELARVGETVVRDFALGLRDYPDFPLLIEGDVPPSSQIDAVAAELISQLWEMASGRTPAQPKAPADFPAWEENRRQAMRHLQWAACRAMRAPNAEISQKLLSLPTFIDPEGRIYTGDRVLTALHSKLELRLKYSGKGRHQLGALCNALGRRVGGTRGAPKTILGGALTYEGLRPHGAIRLDVDFDLTDYEAKRNPHTPHTAFIAEVPIQHPGIRGRVGVTRGKTVPEVVLLDASGTPNQLLRPSDAIGGYLTVEKRAKADELRDVLSHAREQLAVVLCSTYEHWSGSEDRVEGESFLLGFAGQQLSLQSTLRGTVVPKAWNTTADAIFDLPMFPAKGRYVTALQLIQEFCAAGETAKTHDAYALSHCFNQEDNEHLAAWLRETLNEGQVMRHSSDQPGRAPAPSDIPSHSRTAEVGAVVGYWLRELRVDRGAITSKKPMVEVSVVPSSWFQNQGAPTRFVRTASGNPLVYLNGKHPLVVKAVENPEDPMPLSWLLLAAYADINESMITVSNQHEQAFQRRLLEALRRGDLTSHRQQG